MKFKFGEKVKIKSMVFDIVDEVKVGDVGIVEEINTKLEYPIWVQFRDGSSYGFKEDELEFVNN